jgi:hypothetical protein
VWEGSEQVREQNCGRGRQGRATQVITGKHKNHVNRSWMADKGVLELSCYTMQWPRWREYIYSFYSLLTSAVDWVSGQHHVPAELYPGERTSGTNCTGGWWISELVRTQRLKDKHFAPAGDRSGECWV